MLLQTGGNPVRRVDVLFCVRNYPIRLTTADALLAPSSDTQDVALLLVDRRLVRVTGSLVHSDILGKVLSYFPCAIQGRRVRTLRLGYADCYGIAVNSSETLLVASSSHCHVLSFYQLPEFELLSVCGPSLRDGKQLNYPYRLCFNAREDTVLVAEFGNNCVHELALNGDTIRRIPVSGPICVACSGDGRLLAVGTASTPFTLHFIDYKSGKIVGGAKDHVFIQDVDAVRFTPDNAHVIVAGATSEGYFKKFSVSDGTFVRGVCVGSIGGRNDIAFTADGEMVVTDRMNSRLKVFSSDGGTMVHEIALEGDDTMHVIDPTVLCIANNRLYVVGYSGMIVDVYEL